MKIKWICINKSQLSSCFQEKNIELFVLSFAETLKM